MQKSEKKIESTIIVIVCMTRQQRGVFAPLFLKVRKTKQVHAAIASSSLYDEAMQ